MKFTKDGKVPFSYSDEYRLSERRSLDVNPLLSAFAYTYMTADML